MNRASSAITGAFENASRLPVSRMMGVGSYEGAASKAAGQSEPSILVNVPGVMRATASASSNHFLASTEASALKQRSASLRAITCARSPNSMISLRAKCLTWKDATS